MTQGISEFAMIKARNELTDYFLVLVVVLDVPRVVLVVPVLLVGIEVEALGGVLREVVDAVNPNVYEEL